MLRPECRGADLPVVYHHVTRFGPIRNKSTYEAPISGKQPFLSTSTNLKTSSRLSSSFDFSGLASFLSNMVPSKMTGQGTSQSNSTGSVTSQSSSNVSVTSQSSSNVSVMSESSETLGTTKKPIPALDETMSTTTTTTTMAIPTKSWRKSSPEKEETKRKVILPLGANGQFSLDTLSVYTAKNKTNLKPDLKYSSVNLNSNFIKVNILKT